MFLKLRGISALAVGAVLGLTASLGSNVLADRDVENAAAETTDYADLLDRVLERVRSEYVDSVDEQRLVESAIRGILDDLDPHSRYLPPSDYEDVRISTTGNYSGVGLDVSVEGGKVTVVSPLDGAPADKAGIRPGDVLVSVDDVPVDGKNLKETVGRMRGEPGTEVTVAVVREGFDEPLRFALTRADIQVNTVRSALLGDDVGYLRVRSFSNTTAGDLERAAAELRGAAGAELAGLVLDLRNNPGGVLDAAVDVADLFLGEGLIVRGSGRAREARFERHADAGDVLEDVPLVVLVNGGSASASEIVAGALGDHGRGRLVGTRTYGKGSVQTVMPLGGGRAIKLTTSLYITPAGHSINDVGIEPDKRVRNATKDAAYGGPGSTTDASDDEQLQAALSLLGFSGYAASAAPSP